jgi:uncharacterized protein YbjT (DUF2867 family)
VVERLTRAGAAVRAMTRHPEAATLPEGVEVVRGDLEDPDTLSAALRGVERMYLFPVARTAREVVGLARRAGVARIVVLSSGAVTTGYDTTFHLPVERAAEESGLAWTHVRPGEFALNKLWLWGPQIRSARKVSDPMPDLAGYPVHEADIADVATAALLEDGHTSQALTVCGPALLSHREQVSAIAEALGEPVHLEQVTRAEARDLYLSQGGFAAANADFLLGFEDYSGAAPSAAPVVQPPLPTAEAVTGRPARTFADWARDHAADFRA